MKLAPFIILLIATNILFAQSSTEQLAIQYFQNEEYSKAIVLFEELYTENPASEYIYNYYLDCLLLSEQFEDAESFLKKLVKKEKNNPVYKIDLGYVYQNLDNEKKANKLYNDIISDLKTDELFIQKAANTFIKRKETDHAIRVYEKGRKILLDENLFILTLANLYREKGEKEKMINEYFKILYQNPTRLESVQNALQDYIFQDDNYVVVKEALIKEVQKSNYNSSIVDFLSWLYIQKKDFKAAYRQQKALDKRFKNNNQGLVKLSQVCISNEAYDVAEEIYQYIIDKGLTTPYYHHARFGKIDISYLKITKQVNPSEEDLLKLEKEYSNFISREFYKYIDLSEKVIIRLAEIKSNYLNNVSGAIRLLEKYLAVPQISKESLAEMKLNLGDYYVITGDVWEATLLYKQVDKDFKDHELGHKAKFRDAKLAFYRGQFMWAKEYLNILKASTTELISNDALQLALLIQDNIDMDSTEEALSMYARADFFLFKNKYDSAIAVLDTLISEYYYHPIIDETYMLRGDIETKKKNFEGALSFYKKVYEEQASNLLSDDAIYKSALIYENKLKMYLEASKLYEKIILDYAESVYVVDSRKRYKISLELAKTSNETTP